MSISTSKFISYCQTGLSIGLGYGSVAYGVGYVYGHLCSHTSPPLSAAILGISQAAYRTLIYTVSVWEKERERRANPEWRLLPPEESKRLIKKARGKHIRRISACLLVASYTLTSIVMKQLGLISTKAEMGLIGVISLGHTLFFVKPTLLKHLHKVSFPSTAVFYLTSFVAMQHFKLISHYREIFLFNTIALGHLSLIVYPNLILYL